jgi:hypothetical protein
MITDILKALATGAAQVFLVALQSRQIARRASLGWIFVVGIGISAVWIFNVRAAVSSFYVGAAYVLGAGLGTIAAMKVKIHGERQ